MQQRSHKAHNKASKLRSMKQQWREETAATERKNNTVTEAMESDGGIEDHIVNGKNENIEHKAEKWNKMLDISHKQATLDEVI